MNILVNVRKGKTADGYYRAYAPWSVCRLFSNHQITVAPASSKSVAWADVVIFQRSVTAEDELLMVEAKSQGKRVIYDVDDNLFDIPPSCPELYAQYWNVGKADPKPPLAHHKRMLLMADMVTVPTARLGELLRGHTRPDLPVRVVPNMVLRGDWDALTPMESRPPGCDEDTLLIGWMGYVYHWDDWYALRFALDRALRDQNARLVIMGFPEVTRGWPQGLRDKTLVEPVVPFDTFGAMRRMMATLDLAILPLGDSPFNWGKSPLKAFQFGMAGVPILASEVVYGDLRLEHDDLPIFLCPPDPDAWEDRLSVALEWLTHAPSLRQVRALARDWRERVVESHCLESPRLDRVAPLATLWVDVCEEVANG